MAVFVPAVTNLQLSPGLYTPAKQFSLSDMLPIQGQLDVSALSGSRIDFRGSNTALRAFWEETRGIWHFEAYFPPLGSPFLFAHATERAVGSLLELGRGQILFLPQINTDRTGSKAEKFRSALVELENQLRLGTQDSALPEWAEQYMMPGEDAMIAELDRLRAEVEESKSRLASLQQYKLLLAGKGDALQKQVLKALVELGFDAEEGSPGRDDIIARYEGQTAVIEVKGTTKSAAEKHAAQLEKWVSNYLVEHGITPKGILLVNAFCDTPVAERNENPFPHQMLK